MFKLSGKLWQAGRERGAWAWSASEGLSERLMRARGGGSGDDCARFASVSSATFVHTHTRQHSTHARTHAGRQATQRTQCLGLPPSQQAPRIHMKTTSPASASPSRMHSLPPPVRNPPHLRPQPPRSHSLCLPQPAPHSYVPHPEPLLLTPRQPARFVSMFPPPRSRARPAPPCRASYSTKNNRTPSHEPPT